MMADNSFLVSFVRARVGLWSNRDELSSEMTSRRVIFLPDEFWELERDVGY